VMSSGRMLSSVISISNADAGYSRWTGGSAGSEVGSERL
jgi:hypothetical protein